MKISIATGKTIVRKKKDVSQKSVLISVPSWRKKWAKGVDPYQIKLDKAILQANLKKLAALGLDLQKSCGEECIKSIAFK
mgnify:CR=1 FL=1